MLNESLWIHKTAVWNCIDSAHLAKVVLFREKVDSLVWKDFLMKILRVIEDWRNIMTVYEIACKWIFASNTKLLTKEEKEIISWKIKSMLNKNSCHDIKKEIHRFDALFQHFLHKFN